MPSKTRVVVSHELTRAAYSLSLNEKRLVMFAVSKIDQQDLNNGILEINALDCARFYSMSESSARRHLQKSLDALWDRELVTPDGLGHRWIVSRGKYEHGSIFLRFHPDLEPHLLNLKTRFTQYYLERAAEFKLAYTWRIFELIMQFKTTGYLKINLDELKKILELSEYYDSDFGRIRAKVIEPAVKEIRKKDGLKVTWNPIKKGRSVVALEFKFPVEPQHELFKIDKDFIDKHARPGESYEQAGKRLREEAKKQTK